MKAIMQSARSIHVLERSKVTMQAKPPSLVDLSVTKAIDNVRFLGDVGDTDISLLERILPHCNAQQLMHIETQSKGRDLSQVTDPLWFRFYERKFGTRSTNDVVDLMKTKNRKFLWKQVYEDKLKEQDDRQKQSLERLTQSYKKEYERRQSRRIQICDKVPDSRKKRPFDEGNGVGSNIGNVKSKMMKRIRREHLNSIEFNNRIAMKRKGIVRC